MLFSEEDAPLLKAWIVKRIENTSDADADVLAEYVIALLKHDGDKASVRLLCEQEIPDFLTEDSKQFLDDVFQAITYRSYMPGALPPPPPPPLQNTSLEPTAAATYLEASKKRSFDEIGPQVDYRDHVAQGRAAKQARRGRRGGRTDDRLGAYGQAQSQPQIHGQVPGQQYPMGFMMPAFDPNNPMDALMSMQAMGIAFPAMGDASAWYGGTGAAAAAAATAATAAAARGGRGGGSKRRRCRDFDAKGYCSRGSTCNFDHGGAAEAFNQEEYDPGNAMILPFASSDLNHASRGRGGRGGGKQRGGARGGIRAAFSAEGPVSDKSKTAIVVENIPEDDFSEDKIRGFFSQYGEILEISMQPYKHLAIVRFHSWSSANAAYRSPKVIFDNRFVKVFWYKDETDKSKVPPANGAGHNGNPGGLGPDESDATTNNLDPEIDMQEFQRKQEEAQKLHQQREEKKTELQKQRELLELQQQQLLARHQLETERLRAKLAEKNGGGEGASSSAPGSSGTDFLRAKLAALEQEARILGIDPNIDTAADEAWRREYPFSATDAAAAAAAAPPWGGYRGRGASSYARAGYRGRATAFAAAGRGRGGAFVPGHAGRHAAYAQFSIDNRPRKLAMRGVDFTPSERDEQLRHFLLNMGEFESVHTSPTVTHVSFRDRKTAEKFYLTLHGKEFPGLDGKLDLSWVHAASPAHDADADVAINVGSRTGVATELENGPAGDVMAGMDDERDDGDAEREESGAVNMDYEAGW
ncbi:hypothetical protein E4U21_001089 [Claviceps maximensis]|nr:hypothetical protein E4U21_001089 [Claviceps maximensis]